MRRLYELLTERDPSLVEVFLALYALVYGAWLANPLTETFGTISVYRAMASLASEHLWGIGIALFGVAQLAAVTNGDRSLRAWLANLGAAFWLFMAVLTAYSSGLTGVGTGLFSLIIVTETWIFWRITGVIHHE